MKIEKIDIRAVYNNRLEYAVEVEINNTFRGISPGGASVGSKEIKTRDVLKNLKKAKDILKKYEGEKLDFELIDRELKFLKHKIGGNFSTAFSYALFNAYFKITSQKYVFPLPLSNVVGGGMHQGNISIQEILVIPKKKVKTFRNAFEINRRIYLELKEKLKKRNLFLGYNDESALITKLQDEDALSIVSEIAENHDAYVGVDMASSSYYDSTKKIYNFSKKKYSESKYIEIVESLIERYDLKYIEDPFHENDFDSFTELTKKHGKKRIICGDDLTTTNPERLEKCVKKRAITGIIVKPNQIGTLTEAKEVKEMAEKNNIIPVISHRSGEGDDSTISRFSITYGFPIAKIGIAGIRIEKINEFLRLWDKTPEKEVAYPWKTLK